MAHSSGGRLGGRPVGGWTSHRKNAPFLYFHTTRDTTRVAAFLQSDVVSNGMPRYTAWVIVTGVLDGTLWAEWRLLVGRGHAEVTEQGAVAPARLGELLKQRTREIRTRVAEAGLGVRDGILAHDAEAMDGAIE